MRLFTRDAVGSVTRRITAAGASPDVADAIAGALLGCGLSTAEAREWLAHENRSYPIQTPIALIERGDSELVLSAALEFAQASADERMIARLFGGDVRAVRRLTRADPDRAHVIAGIAADLLKRLGDPERVSYVGQTRLPGHGDRRIVDRLLAGQEDAVAAELADGTIDARELERSGELVFTGW